MAQQLGVALIVGLAALYAAWHFMPARWRRALAARLKLGQGAAGGGCHACDDCAGCAPPAEKSSQNRRGPA